MVTPKDTAPKAHSDLSVVLDHFADARSVIECVCIVLEGNADNSDEAICLRVGLRVFQAAYNELDLAIIGLRNSDA